MNLPTLSLKLEQLEDRTLLSSVTILAAGFDGTEQMQLLVDDVAVATFEVASGAATGDFTAYTYDSLETLQAGQIKVAFINDLYLPESGFDRNLRVDAIEIDGDRLETEDPSVFSTGTWEPVVGIEAGFKESEVLHTDGFFQFATPTVEPTVVKVYAAGRIGDEVISLEIAGEEVAVFDLAEAGGQLGDLEARNFSVFSYTTPDAVAPEDVRVNFLNDVFDRESGNLGRDVRIDKIEINDVAYDTEDPAVFSTGYAGPGFWEEEILEFNGYFQYAQPAVPDLTLMKLRASGTSGKEIFQLEIGGETVAVYNLADFNVQPGDLYTGTFAQIIYQHDEVIDPATVRITFLNDQVDPETGIDYDLGIDNFKIGGITYQTEAPSTFSTGTFVEGIGVEPGFRQSESMNAPGYFQYLVDTSANNIPVATNDTYTIEVGETLMGNVLDNDSDADFTQLLKYLSHTDPANGTIVFAANGNFTYAPNPGFSGSDSFRYTAADGYGGVANAYVIVNVGQESNLAPIAVDDSFEAEENSTVTGNLLVNDLDLNNDTLVIQSFTDPTNGSIVIEASGEFAYTPDRGFFGEDTFSYVISDGNGETSTANVTISLSEIVTPTTIEVIARGTTGEELFSLEIDGQRIGSVQVGTTFDSYIFQLPTSFVPEENEFFVRFTNDLIDGEINRDLIVDKIVVNGVIYETEADTTYTTGSWQGAGLPTTGYQNTERLTNNGYFHYSATKDLIVYASGDEGNEQFELLIDEVTVATYNVGTEFTEFRYQAPIDITPERIRIQFVGDQFEPENGIDKNVNVAYIEVDGRRVNTDDPVVFSTGTWTDADGIVAGFGRGTTLHTDGYFQFASPPTLPVDQFEIPEDSIDVPLAVLANDETPFTAFEIAAPPVNGTAVIVDGELLYTPSPDYTGSDVLFYRETGSTGEGIRVDIEVMPSHQQPQHLLNPEVASELTPSGKFLLVEKVAQLPRADNGGQPRMNSMTTLGDRIFVVTDGSVQGEGKIYELVTQNGETSVELFFDVGQAVTANTGLNIDNSSPLNGLRSFDFHPEFANNGKLYITYTGERPTEPYDTTYLSEPETPVDVESVLAEFTFDFTTNSVDASSYREVFRVGMQNSEHSIRQAIFNPYAIPGDEDYGLLYIGHGDGSEQSAVSGDGMNNDALGKILRIDPLATDTAPYATPSTNPYVGDPDMIDEAYAIGFRNPHNLTFAIDTEGNVQLIVTEIGRDNIEEINIVQPGKNYGWAEREGVFVHSPASGTINGIDNLPADEALNGYTFPNAFWGHEGVIGESFVGQAIAGGHVIQNGSSELDNQFIFVEFATDGRAYHVDFSAMLAATTELNPDDPLRGSPAELTWVTPQELTILFDHDSDPSTTPLVRSSLKDVLDDEPDFQTILSAGKVRADLRLGQGPNGELYILNKRNGWVYVATNTQPPATSEPPATT